MQNLYNLDNVRPWLKAARAHARDECSAVAMERPILSMDCIGIVHKKWKKMVKMVSFAIIYTAKSLKSIFSFQKSEKISSKIAFSLVF